MDVNIYATQVYALVMGKRATAEAAYDRNSETNAFWCFVDLVNSSKYRMARGPKKGYVRGETFFSLVNAAIAPSSDVHHIKEIGDAVFLSCRDFTPLFESVLLMDYVASQIAGSPDDREYPFGIRVGLGGGPAKRLIRESEDYLGRPIDELSRIMAVRSEISNILVQDNVFSQVKDLLREYSDFLRVGDSKMVPYDLAKGAPEPIYYRELIVDRSSLGSFRQSFFAWRKAMPGTASN